MRLFCLFLSGLLALAPGLADARRQPSPVPGPLHAGTRVERLVLLYRHGVRAPLAGEAGMAPLASAAMPGWVTPESLLTPHGAAAIRLLARYQGGLWRAAGLLPATGCPTAADLAIWTNTPARTIATGEALAAGLAPGCAVAVGHLPAGRHDPVFEQREAGGDPFNAAQAARDVNRSTGGAAAMARHYAPALRRMAQVLGCDRARPPCRLAALPGAIAPAADGRSLAFSGPVEQASGTAQIFLLQYMEGFAPAEVGWGRAGPAVIAALSPLHAALFDVFDRSPYMAPRSASVLARRMLSALFDAGQPRLTLLVGHDNNIAAMGALLRTRFRVPGLGWNDPPPGGALGLALLRRADGRQMVRAFYVAARPGQVR
ncbi:MAG TPA: histidine-type phosphatase, partial [Novosphingobium sp.]|nr:histidine-type phosphatase [Novosphingobium sp.]